MSKDHYGDYNGNSGIFLIVGAVLTMLAILWFAFSGGADPNNNKELYSSYIPKDALVLICKEMKEAKP